MDKDFKTSPLFQGLLSKSDSWSITAAKVISVIIYIILRYILRYRYEVIIANLAKAFPSKNRRALRDLATSYYQHMGDLFVEPFLFYIVSHQQKRSLVTYTNEGLLQRLHRDDRQVVLLASHYGNWEYLSDLPQVVDYHVYSAFSPIKNPYVDKLMLNIRSFRGLRLIPRQHIYRNALRMLRDTAIPKMIIMIADQRPAAGSVKFHLPFLHQDTKVQIGGERMAASAESAVVYLESCKTSRFHYSYTFHMISENAAHTGPMEITRKYFENLEKSINGSPAYWLWSHNRWAQTSR
jgi:KDO2-lipid IV(A) lauroyltransferase